MRCPPCQPRPAGRIGGICCHLSPPSQVSHIGASPDDSALAFFRPGSPFVVALDGGGGAAAGPGVVELEELASKRWKRSFASTCDALSFSIPARSVTTAASACVIWAVMQLTVPVRLAVATSWVANCAVCCS